MERGYPRVNDEMFLRSVSDGDLELVKLFLEAGISIDAREQEGVGTTALLQAAALESPEVALFLIERGANVNAADQFARTPLMAAAETVR